MARGGASWEEQRRQQVDDFIQGWTWERVCQHWIDRLQDFNITLEPLFQAIRVHDPANPVGRKTELACWPRKSVQEQHLDCQQHFDSYPGTRGPTHPDARTSSAGESATIDYLWESRGDPDMVAAVLIAASLFSRMQSTRRRYPESWPPFPAVERLAEWACERWQGSRYVQGWHHSCTTVLPYVNKDYLYKIDSMYALVRYLAEEHASFLLKFRLIAVEFGEEPDPFIASALRHKKKAEQQREAEWIARRKEEEKAEQQRIAELRRAHPRYGEWGSVSADELERLVWSKAISRLAKEFGVSDVAIGKRCKSLGIERPPRGFWSKVAAGKTPHPQGRPPTGRPRKNSPSLKVVR